MSTTFRRLVRSWKEHWDPSADLIFLKRLKLDVDGAVTVQPGDPVTPRMREVLGTHRLKIWWNGRFVGSSEYAIKVGIVTAATDTVAKPTPPPLKTLLPVTITELGGNWYDVRRPDGVMQKVRGKKKALEVSQG